MVRCLWLPLLAASAFADIASQCNASVKDTGGNINPITCSDYGKLESSISAGDRALDINIVNYYYGGVYSGGDTVDASGLQHTFSSLAIAVFGGQGAGSLVLSGSTDLGVFTTEGVSINMSYASNFLPYPEHYPGHYGDPAHALLVPFVFGAPFALYVETNISFNATLPYARSDLAWEGIYQWDASLIDIVDSSGNSVAGAHIVPASVPEPNSIVLLFAAVVLIAIVSRSSLRQTHTACSKAILTPTLAFLPRRQAARKPRKL